MSTIDLRSYSRLPSGSSIGDIVTLARQLEAAAPASPSAPITAALRQVRESADGYQTKRAALDGIPRAVVARPYQRLRRAWNACARSLDARAVVDDDLAKKATELGAENSAHDATIAHGTAAELWAASDLILRAISAPEVHAPLEEIVGAAVLSHVLEAHDALGHALGVDGATGSATESRSGAAAPMRRAIYAYLRVLMGELDVEDDASLARFRNAVKPLDELRAARGSSPGTRSAPVKATAPVVAADSATPTNGAAGGSTHAA